MNPLEPPDKFQVSAALGWLELGNLLEAARSLDEVSPASRNHPEVLEVRWQIHASQSQWDACVVVADALVQAAPESPFGWIHRACALRRAPNGSLQAAWDALLPAFKKFPGQPMIPYNLACFACQMGNLKETRRWLERAFEVGDPKQLRSLAQHDPELQLYWQHHRQL